MDGIARYLIEEHVEDFQDGLITRRELLRRVALITGSATAAVAALEAAGCGSAPTGSPPSPTGRASSTPRPFATPPAQPTTDGVTVQPNDPRIRVEALRVKGADGTDLIDYHARPASGPAQGGILVVHENRGLVVHIQDVVRRVATAGFAALSVDLLSRDGGAQKLSDPAQYQAALARRGVADMVSDLREALLALSKSHGIGDKLGITGFCFGGGMVWNTLVVGAGMKAAVPFYGPMPADPSGIAHTKAAVFAIYAEKDTRITSTKDQMEAELKKSGRPYRITVYPGVDHAFHNDTGARYNAEQAELAWVATIEWFRRYVR
jgi:carboxymethylenebutenolidase